MLPTLVFPCSSEAETDGKQDSGWLYLGKPMSHWVADLHGKAPRDPEFLEMEQYWVLANFGQAAVPHLIDAMREPWNVDALVQLEFLGSTETVQQVAQAVRHPHEWIRCGALQVLFGLQFKRFLQPEITAALRDALPIVAEAARESEPALVRQTAERFVQEYGPILDPAFPLPSQDWEAEDSRLRRAAVERVARLRCRPEEVAALVKAKLRDPDASVRWAAAGVLSSLEPDHPDIVPLVIEAVIRREHGSLHAFRGVQRIVSAALPVLQEALRDPDPRTRASIVNALGWSKSPTVLPFLIEMQKDESAMVRRRVINSLNLLDAPEIVPCLMRALGDGDCEVREETIRVIRRQRALRREILQGLIGVLDSGSEVARVAAALTVDALGQEGQDAWPALRENLDNSDPRVRLAAILVLARNEPGPDGVVPRTSERDAFSAPPFTESRLKALLRFGQRIEAIVAKLTNGLKPVSSRALSAGLVKLLGPLAAPALPRLISLLEDTSLAEPGSIQDAIANIGSAAVGPLVELLEHTDLRVRNRAIKTLGLMGFRAAAAVPKLVERLAGGSLSERILATEALGNIGPAAASAVPAFRAALGNRDLAVLRETMDALGKMKRWGEPAVAALVRLLDAPSLTATIKWQVVRALRGIGPAATTALLACLGHRDPLVRASAARELGGRGPWARDVVPALMVSLQDPDAGVRASAAESLGSMAAAAHCAAPGLRRLLDDWCDIVREKAQKAIEAVQAARRLQAAGGPDNVSTGLTSRSDC
ncbi:MAG: HEAT repeat domain-containing protein [Pirellulales bacterium]|nr:HEAT repeat domain-containing protein [Pirellulales bacterium]